MGQKKGRVLPLLALALLTACGSGAAGKDGTGADGKALTEASDPAEAPATVRFFCGCDQAFADFVKERTARAYPNITLDTILISQQNSIDNVLAAGTSLDLVYYSLGGVYLLKDRALTSDLAPQIAKTKFDMTKLVAGAEETMRSYSAGGGLEYMPFDQKPLALFYNKDLFDKFAVPYPKDDMTWSQATELAKAMTRQEGGVDYYGLNFNAQQLLYKNQLGLPFVNAQTNAAALDTDGWKGWMNEMAAVFRLPGMLPALPLNNVNQFQKDKTLAMVVTTNMLGTPALESAIKEGLNWDVVSVPNFAGQQGGQLNTNLLTIPVASKNKDAAFAVIRALLSPETQLIRSRQGIVPILDTPDIRGAFAADLPYAKGKNIQALHKDTIAKPIAATKFDGGAKDSIMVKTFRDVAAGNNDVVTALRSAQEEMNKYIASQR